MLLWCFVTFNDWLWFWYQKLHKKSSISPHFLPGTVAAKPGGKGGLSGALRMIPIPAGEVRKIINPKVPCRKKGRCDRFPWKVIAIYTGWVWLGIHFSPQPVTCSLWAKTNLHPRYTQIRCPPQKWNTPQSGWFDDWSRRTKLFTFLFLVFLSFFLNIFVKPENRWFSPVLFGT